MIRLERFYLLAAPLLWSGAAQAQFAKKNPFSVGVNEGSVGEVGRLGMWLLSEQARFYDALRQAVEAANASHALTLSLAAISFAYGVFHAAGPGHGKAVLTSYMLANERALKRGLVLSAFAALLQAVVAIAIVGVAAALLGVTAQKMAGATQWVEAASFACIAGLGAFLVWRKGAAFWAAWRESRIVAVPAGRFSCDDSAHEHGPDCGHYHGPDPKQLGDGFSWGQGLATVVAAGSRPCSGAILVLVFAFAQGAFAIGVWATLAMAAGTALTTGALAASAVLAKGAMQKVLGKNTTRAELAGRGLEVLAASAVLFLGLSLFVGMMVSGAPWQ